MSNAPHVEINLTDFWNDPYPTLARLRKDTPIAYVPQLGGVVITRRDHIASSEKLTHVFSSHQPDGLMNKLMGQNMMRKDGHDHAVERKAIFPSVSPRAVKTHWTAVFQAHADRIIKGLAPNEAIDLCRDFALPFSAECLKSITGLVNVSYQEINAWSQAMIDGIANYAGDPAMELRCRASTEAIDAAIDEMIPVLTRSPDLSMLSTMMASGMPLTSIQANIKLAISGGQNEPRDAISGAVWALLSHPDQLALVENGTVPWLQVFEEYARWISPIGMSPRRIAQAWSVGGIALEPEDRVFFMFGSANRDESHFERPHEFDVLRDTSKSITFGAGPHFCAGAWASRAMVADVALPAIFARLPGLRLVETTPVRIGGWAFRGLLNLPVMWGPAAD